jgi:SAM-dependent methyltransferase
MGRRETVVRLQVLLSLLRKPHLRAQVRLGRDLVPLLRLHFLCAASQAGILGALQPGGSVEEIAEKLGIGRVELLDAMLRLGVSLRELSRRGSRYQLRGPCSRALAAESADPLAAIVEEFVTYGNSVYRHFSGRLRDDPLGDYLESTAALVARSSRTVEPWLAGFLRDQVRERRPQRMLDVGCGSGVYMLRASELDPGLTGTGIDMRSAVVEQARANLARWGIDDRFRVRLADVRSLPADAELAADLIIFFNASYYFAPADRVELFRRLRSLAPTGALVLANLTRGESVFASHFDLMLRSTLGSSPLPDADDLVDQLKRAGFGKVTVRKLLPTEPLYGIVAS